MHPMRIVVQRTGLSPDLLRAWEKRYSVVAPTRSAGGQRLYSDEDVQRLTLLTRAVNGGRAISQVAKLPMSELQAVVERDALAIRVTPTRTPAVHSESREAVNAAALLAVERLDAAGLEFILRGAVLRLGIDEALDGVFGPLLFTIGARWRSGILRPAHEHMASAVIRHTLALMAGTDTSPATAPTLVVATPAGQTHELGAILVAAAAVSQGWRVVYLGANLPADEIATAAGQTRAVAVALSLVYPADDPLIADALRDLRAALPAGTAIIVGGSAAASYAAALSAVGATTLATIGELRSWLRRKGAGFIFPLGLEK